MSLSTLTHLFRDHVLQISSSDSETGFQTVFISSRFTKKSLVRTSGRLVKTPCLELSKFVFKTRMPPTRTVISGAVSVSNWALSTSNSSVANCDISFSDNCGNHRLPAQAPQMIPHRFAPAMHPCDPG